MSGPGRAALGLRVASLLIGFFIFCMGLSKIEWLLDSGILVSRLEEWRGAAPPVSRWYLERIAIPGAPVFARLVPVAELAAGAALMAGVRVRLAATLSLLMILNFHFASDVLFHVSYLTNAYGLPVLGCLLAVAIGGSNLPFSLSR